MSEAKHEDGWKETRDEIRRGEHLRFEWRQASIPGTWMLEAIHEHYPFPLGTVWFRFVGNKTIEILHSFVVAGCRRAGLRTRMHHFMQERYPDMVFMTAQGNEMSTPWLEANGFTQDEVTGDWRWVPDPRTSIERYGEALELLYGERETGPF